MAIPQSTAVPASPEITDTIDVPVGMGTRTVQVYQRRGLFALTQGAYGHGYAVTHLPTGYQVGLFSDGYQPQAEQLLMLAAAIGRRFPRVLKSSNADEIIAAGKSRSRFGAAFQTIKALHHELTQINK